MVNSFESASEIMAGARTSASRSFFVGWWRNRRHTRTISSLIIGAVLSIALFKMQLEQSFLMHDPDYAAYGIGITVALILNVLFFPTAREGYYRIMRPVHEGLSGFWVGGILLLIVLAVRTIFLVALWAFAIPLGLLGGIYLGASEVRGNGWRVQ